MARAKEKPEVVKRVERKRGEPATLDDFFAATTQAKDPDENKFVVDALTDYPVHRLALSGSYSFTEAESFDLEMLLRANYYLDLKEYRMMKMIEPLTKVGK